MVAGAPYYALAKEREGAPSFFPRIPSLFLVISPALIWSKVNLFFISFSTLFDLFKINEEVQPYIDALTNTVAGLNTFQGCET